MLALWLAHAVLATRGWRQWSCLPPHHGHGQFRAVLLGAEVHAPGGLQSPLFSTLVKMWCYWVQLGPLWDLESPSRCHSKHPRLSVFPLRRSSYSTLDTQTSNWNNPALIGPDRGWSSSGAAVFCMFWFCLADTSWAGHCRTCSVRPGVFLSNFLVARWRFQKPASMNSCSEYADMDCLD